MNLSDDLTPPADPAPLFRALRRRRHLRLAARAGLACALTMAIAAGLWPRTASRSPVAIVPAPIAPPTAASAAAATSVTMTRAELLDSLKDETYALIRWPDGREQLLLRR